MVFCFQAELAFATAVRRDQVLADIQAEATTATTWGDTLIVASVREFTGEPTVSVAVRFSAQPAQQAITNRIEAFATGPRTPLAGSWYSLHPCPHDEAQPVPCVEDSRRVW